MKELAGAVVVHDHVHLGRPHQDGIKVDTDNMLGKKVLPSTAQCLLLALLAATTGLNRFANLFKYVVHASD